jgi:peptidoglycan-N-acetylglucosamine deacetylase
MTASASNGRNGRRLLRLAIFTFTVFVSTCDSYTPVAVVFCRDGGVILTFDDASVDEWYRADSLLTSYNWRATFCVAGFPSLPGDQVNKLILLQKRGHEISCHGTNHADAVEYLSKHTPEEYFRNEVLPSIEAMNGCGLRITSFAYPYGSRNHQSDSLLLQHFSILRGVNRMRADCFATGDRIVFAHEIDGDPDSAISFVKSALAYAKEYNKIVILYAHVPKPAEIGSYTVSYRTLKEICSFCVLANIRFLTLHDLALPPKAMLSTPAIAGFRR